MLRRYSIALLLLFVVSFRTHSAGGLQQVEIEKFRLECWSNPAYDIELKFAPVRRLADESRPKGKWSYEFINDDGQNSEATVKLPASAAARVDLVTQLNQKDSDIGESYLWNVIVAPKVSKWRFGGHWPAKKSISEYQRMTHKRDSLISVASLSVYNDEPVHTRIPPKDIDSAGTLNSAWETLFGEKIVSRLVYPASKGEGGYSLTFYYMPTPALRFINEEGYRWPSFKHVDQPGKVYGFVLSPEGECLASTAVDVVNEL